MRDVIVVGAGIIGTTVSTAFRLNGAEVLTLDDGRPNAGTPPSGGHLKPSWFRDMPKSEYEPAMEMLERCWGLKAEEFQVWPTSLTTIVYRVDTDQVAQSPKETATVIAIEHVGNYPLVRLAGGREERCRLLVVAAGAWCFELLPEIKTVPKQGVSFRVRGRLEQPFIRPWAPYKQIVAHEQAERKIWIGDGSAVLPSNWDEERTAACLRRCFNALDGGELLESRFGWRPYANPERKGEPCLLRRLGPRCWVATGAGKSGTIAAGWVARRILNAVR